jgi:hypothetical protein
MYSTPTMVTYAAAPQSTNVIAPQPVMYAAPPANIVPTYTTISQPTVLPMQTAAQLPMVLPMPAQAQAPTLLPMPAEAQPSTSTAMVGPQKLAVSILEAHGLQHMNHFIGDHPYVTCEAKGVDGQCHTRLETKPVTEGDTMNPFWGETLIVDPWNPEENLEFSVYDKGLVGSRTEGKVVLPHELFYPTGFSGMLRISGLPHALLHILVRPMGPSSKEAAVDAATPVETSSKKTKRKLTVGKKQKGCC